MSLVTLADVLQPALRQGYAVAGLVALGWEDMRAFVAAAEAEQCPVILQAGPGCRAHTPLPVLGAMFRHLAESAGVPVVAHLDHGYSLAECRQAVDCGFTSLMFDGSTFPLERNRCSEATYQQNTGGRQRVVTRYLKKKPKDEPKEKVTLNQPEEKRTEFLVKERILAPIQESPEIWERAETVSLLLVLVSEVKVDLEPVPEPRFHFPGMSKM